MRTMWPPLKFPPSSGFLPALASLAAFGFLTVSCAPPDETETEQAPEKTADASALPADYGRRHKDFSRLSVHLLGAIEGFRFADREELDEARVEFAGDLIESAEVMLERHEGFPPHPSALEEPERIARWQEAMKEMRAAVAALEQAAGREDAAEAVESLDQAFKEAVEHSGYPGGTIEFLEWRGLHKMARDMDPALRLRFADEIASLLESGRDRFVAERRSLVPTDQLSEFDERVKKLLSRQVESVREAGPIPDSTAYELHEHYPYFHHPEVLADLIERQKKQ